MKHQRFFGTALKGKYKQIRGEEIVSNRFFANENLQAINPKQLIHLHGMEFEYVLQGQGFNNASPLKQPKNTNIRKNVEILNQPKTRTIHSPYQADQLLSPLIRIRRCSVEKESTKQRTQEPNYSHNQQRKRAFSFADERVISPKRRRANTQFRNLYNNSENQANQDI